MSELLARLLEILTSIESLVALGPGRFEADELVQFSVERLWIYAGNLAEEHRRTSGLLTGSEPWSELYGYRNLMAHALPGEITARRVWQESSLDVPGLLDLVRQSV